MKEGHKIQASPANCLGRGPLEAEGRPGGRAATSFAASSRQCGKGEKVTNLWDCISTRNRLTGVRNLGVH
jgi:hypothetical protein